MEKKVSVDVYNREARRIRVRFICLTLVFVVTFFISFLLGRYPITPVEVLQSILSKIVPSSFDIASKTETVLFQIRLPRVLMAVLIGAGLSCAGASYQGIFKNPMVSPDVVSASSGAGFGAALGLFLSFDYHAVSVCALFFGLVAVGVVYAISRKVRFNPTLGLVLAGMMVSSLFTSSVSFLKLIADPLNTLPSITYWLMGSLASIRPEDVSFAALFIIFGMLTLFVLRWQINILTLGEEEARCIGVRTNIVRLLVIFSATLITAAAVSVSGMIGWVGLIIPHIARILVGSDYRRLLPACVLLGGSFLLIVDNFARLLATSEIPIGILTAFVGAPFFLYLMVREGKHL